MLSSMSNLITYVCSSCCCFDVFGLLVETVRLDFCLFVIKKMGQDNLLVILASSNKLSIFFYLLLFWDFCLFLVGKKDTNRPKILCVTFLFFTTGLHVNLSFLLFFIFLHYLERGWRENWYLLGCWMSNARPVALQQQFSYKFSKKKKTILLTNMPIIEVKYTPTCQQRTFALSDC